METGWWRVSDVGVNESVSARVSTAWAGQPQLERTTGLQPVTPGRPWPDIRIAHHPAVVAANPTITEKLPVEIPSVDTVPAGSLLPA